MYNLLNMAGPPTAAIARVARGLPIDALAGPGAPIDVTKTASPPNPVMVGIVLGTLVLVALTCGFKATRVRWRDLHDQYR